MKEELVWTEDLSVGNEVIDAQHKYFITLANYLYDKLQHDAEPSNIENILNIIYEEAVIHFRTEEKFLECQGYPFVTEHKQYHKELEDISKSLVGQRLTLEKAVELKVILFDHLMRHDSHYRTWLKSKDNGVVSSVAE